MSFVKGQTTWQNLVSKMVQLACGEVADDAGTTVASGDRWRRMGQNADHAIKMPASADVNSGPQANRIGYFAATSNALRAHGGVTPGYDGVITTTSVRVTACFTANQTYTGYGTPPGVSGSPRSDPSHLIGPITPARWMVNVYCTQANTVAGNYSTSKWTVRYWDADYPENVAVQNNTPGTGFFVVSNLSPAADGTITVTGGGGLTLKVSDPSGIVQTGLSYLRLFTASTNGGYLGGIDYWPSLWRGTASSVTFDTPPASGVSGTDYEVVAPGGAHAQYPGSVIGGNGYDFTDPWYIQGPIWISATRMGFGLGLGIKTNTALDGSRYLVHWNMTPYLCRLFAGSGGSNGQVYMEPGLVDTDQGAPGGAATVSGAYAFSTGGTNFLKPFATPGAVDPNAPIQYWMKVTDKCLVIGLNADPGFSGTTTQNWIMRLDPFDGDTVETFPVLWGNITFDAATWNFGHTLQARWQNENRQNGLKEGARDWQTGWMRSDVGTGEAAWAGLSNGNGGDSTGPNDTHITTLNPNSNVTQNPYDWAVHDNGNGPLIYPINQVETRRNNGSDDGSTLAASTFPDREAHPDPYDGTWRLYASAFVDSLPQWPGDNGRADFRGYMNCGVFFLPGYLWAAGDELVDTSAGGATYFLFASTYHGTGYRFGGGLAIAEV